MPRKFWTPLKVGILTLAAVSGLVFAVLQVTKDRLSDSNSYKVFAIFDDVSGLRSKSKVQIAGIEVGQIDSVSLVGDKAKVVLRIKNDIVLYSDAKVSKRSEGFIGDYMLDISPGHKAPRIPDGGQIHNVVSAGSMEQIFTTLSSVTKDIQSVTSSLKQVLGGEKGAAGLQKIIQDMTSLTESVNKTILQNSERLDDILENFQQISAQARDLTTGESGTISKILANIEVVTRQVQGVAKDLQDVLGTVKDVLGTNQGNLKEGVAGLRQSLTKLNESLSSINKVTSEVAQGKGTVGRLLTDDTLVNDIQKTVSNASDFVDRLTGLKTEVRLRSEYFFNHASSREEFTLKLEPATDKWYEIGVVSPIPTYVPQEIITYDAAGNETRTSVVQRQTALTFNALMAHRWRFSGWSVTGKFGLIETTGALAGNIGLFNEHLKLSVEIFDFGDQYKKWPRLRAFATLSFMDHLFLTAGIDDALNARMVLPAGLAGAPELQNRPRDFFAGAGFYFTDQDLTSLLTITGVPKP